MHRPDSKQVDHVNLDRSHLALTDAYIHMEHIWMSDYCHLQSPKAQGCQRQCFLLGFLKGDSMIWRLLGKGRQEMGSTPPELPAIGYWLVGYAVTSAPQRSG